MEVSMPGTLDRMETEMVTTVGSTGATNIAFRPGSMDVRPRLSTSERNTVNDGMDPFSTNGSSSPTGIVQSLGRMVTAGLGMAEAPEVVRTESTNKIAAMRTTLRDINILAFMNRFLIGYLI